MFTTAAALGCRCGLAAIVAAGAIASAGARAEDTLNIATWGGAYGQSQEIAYFEPFAKETGTRIATEIYDGTLAKLKEMIGGSESNVDVVDVSAATLGTLCNDGLLETIEASSLGAAPSGETAEQDFYSGALSSCGVGSVAWSTAIAFDRQAFTKAQPTQIADLLDSKKYPGKRALPNGARYTLELALLADGADPAEVYTLLATPEGADRAFKALDKIKGEIFWWDTAQEPITWLLEKKAALAAGYSGRIFRAAVGDRQRIGVIWDGQIYDLDLWAIPKGAKNKDGAKRFVAFATDPARLATQAQLIAYGPMRKSAVSLVGKHPVIDVEMKDYLPTSPDNFKKALRFDDAWWSAHGADLQKRFEEWRGPVSPGQGKPAIEMAKPDDADQSTGATKAAP
ncbi:MAG TPA: extracellular solute-binding protein [Methyloceanibacter sp.]|jgi:putative spermidine/putrescine transport system substrate-binding protein|nr:extracellular solute-binding protein [Methyloceanibacter sp.]